MNTFLSIVSGIAILAVLLLGAGTAMVWEPDRQVSALAPRWAPPPSQFLDLQRMRVHYRDEGPKSDPIPLLLIHGTSASLHTWDGWADIFRGGRRVIRMDLPGFGLTGPSADDDYRIATYMRFVGSCLDALGVERVVLAGNSLGGNIAWRYAQAHPERVERLILVDAAGYPFDSASVPLGFRVARIPLLNQIAAHALPRSVVENSVKNVYGDPSRVTPELVDRYFDLTLRAGNRVALARRFEQNEFGADAALAKGVKVPTLILWGGRDRLIPLQSALQFQRDIAGSKLAVFDDLGHVPHEEDPARTAGAVKGFLGL
jgi:pimeloyl-ACP methyl ester carboxylesterase